MRNVSRHQLKNFAMLAGASLLTLLAIGLVVTLQARAEQNRNAEVDLAHALTEFNAFQTLPYTADREPAEVVRRRMQLAQRRIERNLSELRRGSLTPELSAASAPLNLNFDQNQRARMLIARGPDQPQSATAAIASEADRSQAAAARALDEAGEVYAARAARALNLATYGAAGGLIILLASFSFFFLRSSRARSIGDALSAENERLLAISQDEALTDALTGLANRRALMTDLADALAAPWAERELVFVLFDLDGFKQYNDTFGHPAGDDLLVHLGGRFASTMAGIGGAYRLGGDEFCILAQMGDVGGEGIARLAAAALSDDSEGFTISASYGLALLPTETSSSEEALRLADQRMYAQKASGRSSAARQSTDVLLRVLAERSSELGEHLDDVARLAQHTARGLGLDERVIARVALAGELHDVGKTGIPDVIIEKPGALNEEEWAFMREHSVIGERIVLSAPSLAPIAQVVRASHERVDGTGYPDQLQAEEIPLEARIIAVCDAFNAMVSERPYATRMTSDAALAELRRCAGTQFDPAVVAAFEHLDRENLVLRARPDPAPTPHP